MIIWSGKEVQLEILAASLPFFLLIYVHIYMYICPYVHTCIEVSLLTVLPKLPRASEADDVCICLLGS